VKSIQTPVVIEKTKKVISLNKKPDIVELNENESINYTKVAIVAGVVVVFGVVVYYFYPDIQSKLVDIFSDLFDGSRRPKPRPSPPDPETELIQVN
jgi:hypothetical protein